MLSIAHTLISLPFGVYGQNLVTIFIAAFILHLLADTLLHWNVYQHHKPFYLLAAIDVIAGPLVAWAILGDQVFTIPVLTAIAGGNAPDVVHGFWDMASKKQRQKLPGWLQWFFITHNNLQHETPSIPKGLILQLVLIGGAIYLVT